MWNPCPLSSALIAGATPRWALLRLACAVGVAAWALVPQALAAEGDSAAAPRVAPAAGVVGVEPFVADPGVSVVGPTGVLEPTDEVALRERLATIRLDLAVDRDLDAGDAALVQLLLDVMATAPFEGKAALVAEVLVARAELELQRDRPQRAAAILRGEQTPASADADAWHAALAHPAVAEVATRVEALLARGASTLDDEFLEVVRTALEQREEKVLEDLGTRASPYLVALIEPADTSPRNAAWDPLTWLARLDSARFLHTVRGQLEDDTLASPERVARSLLWLDWGDDQWVLSPGRPARLRSQDRSAVIAAVLARPEVFREHQNWHAMAQLLAKLTARDGLPLEAARALGSSCLELPDSKVLPLFDQYISGLRRLQCVVPTHEILLGHAADSVRVQAATWLARWPPSTALLACAGDHSPRVRQQVARSMTEREELVAVYTQAGVEGATQLISPILGPVELATLAVLARDVDATVRHMAATAMVEPVASAGVPDAVYLELARDPEVSVRQLLTGLRHPDAGLTRDVLAVLATDADALVRVAVVERDDLDPALLAELLTTLAGDDDALVREAVARRVAAQQPATLDGAVVLALADDGDPRVRAALAPLRHAHRAVERALLERLAQDTSGTVLTALDERLRYSLAAEWTADPEAWIALVEARREHPTRPLVVDGKPLGRDHLPTGFTRHPLGIVACSRWALASDDPFDWNQARSGMGSHTYRGNDEPVEAYKQAFAQLHDDELQRLLAYYQSKELHGDRWLLDHLVEHAGDRVALLEVLWSDEQQTLGVRLMAAAGLASATPEAADELVQWTLAWLGQRTPESPHLSGLEAAGVRALLKQLPGEQSLSITTAGLALPSLDSFVANELGYNGKDLDEPAYLLAYLQRFAPLRSDSQLTRDVLRALAHHPGLMPDGWLESFIEDPEQPRGHGVAALTVIGSRRDPADIPFLARVLRADWQPLEWNRGPLVETARDALVAQLSNEAAEVLLAAAATATTDKERTLLMDGVQSIQEYQDARALWERRLATGATREDSIAALVRLTGQGGSDQRVQAVRGLATLRAVDQLPLLIGLLGDDDAAVVAAARAALDSLNSEPVSAGDG